MLHTKTGKWNTEFLTCHTSPGDKGAIKARLEVRSNIYNNWIFFVKGLWSYNTGMS